MPFHGRLLRWVLRTVLVLLLLCWLSGVVGVDPKLSLAVLLVLFAVSGAGSVMRFFQKLLVVALLLLMLPWVMSEALRSADPLPALVSLALVSLGAYWIRERRLRKRHSQTTVRGAERTPALPSSGFES